MKNLIPIIIILVVYSTMAFCIFDANVYHWERSDIAVIPTLSFVISLLYFIIKIISKND